MKLNREEQKALRNTFLFFRLSGQEFRQIAETDHPGITKALFDSGDIVPVSEGGENRIGIVISGSYAMNRGDGIPALPIGESYVIGALDLFSRDEPRPGEIRVITGGEILFITASQMEQLFGECPELMRRYIYFLTGQIHSLQQENRISAESASETRLARYFASRAIRRREGYEVLLDCPYSALAAILHMSRASLYRALDSMEQRGEIQREGRRIRLLTATEESLQRFV